MSEANTLFLAAALFIAAIMAVGGMFGLMNTMFAAVSQRTKDIAVLRILGYPAVANSAFVSHRSDAAGTSRRADRHAHWQPVSRHRTKEFHQLRSGRRKNCCLSDHRNAFCVEDRFFVHAADGITLAD
jgi:hypothetical protein